MPRAPSRVPTAWAYRPQLPRSWRPAPLASLASWINGRPFCEDDFTAGEGLPVIKIAEVKAGISAQTRFATAGGDSATRISAGDLLFSWSGQPETSIDAFRWRGPDGWLNQHLFRVLPAAGVDKGFLFCMLRYLRPHFVEIARNKQTTGLGHVTMRDMQQIRCAVPPPPEQRAIAAVLGALDDKIELNRRMCQTLEAMARALFKSWFVDFDPVRAKAAGRPTGLPKQIADLFPASLVVRPTGQATPRNWDMAPLVDDASIVSGGTPSTARPEYWSGDVSWFTVADSPQPGQPWVLRTQKQISSVGLAASPATILPVGTTIITARGTVGRTALVGAPMATNQSCYGVHPPKGARGFYAYYALRNATGELQRQAHGSVFDTITRTTLTGILAPRPAADVVAAFEHAVEPALLRCLSALENTAALAALRDTLLPKLISGEIRVKDAEKFAAAAL